MAIMATGLFVTIVSIIRLTLLYPKKRATGVSVQAQYPLSFWALLEVNLALTCACAPALKQFVGGSFPMLQRFTSALTSKMSGSSRSTEPHSKYGASSFSGGSRFPWSKKSGSTHHGSESRDAESGIKQDISISMDQRFKNGSYLELGTRKEASSDTASYGPTTHVSAGAQGLHSHSSQDPMVKK